MASGEVVRAVWVLTEERLGKIMVDLLSEARVRAEAREGFAIPAVIFALVLMSMLAVVSLVTARDEELSSRAMHESAGAFYAAEAGFNQLLATWNDSLANTLQPGDSLDLGWQSLDGGARYRGVISRYDNGGQKMFALTVEGRGPGAAGGQRVVSLMLAGGGGSGNLIVNVVAPLASITGMVKTGESGLVSGIDVATTTGPWGCPEAVQDTIPGAVTPDSSLWQDDPAPENLVNETTPWLDGDPHFLWGGTQDDVANSLGVDWSAMLALMPDYIVNTESDWPPNSAFNGIPKPWPVIFVGPNVDLDGFNQNCNQGQGLIIAPTHLELGGGFCWNGLILVGDDFHSHGQTKIYGGIMSGLNILLGQDPVESDLGNGTKTILYNSCNILAASNAAVAKGAPLAGGGGGGTKPLGSRAFGELLR